MEDTTSRAIAIVGAGAVLPDAPNVAAFWENLKSGRYSIREVPRDRWDAAQYYDPDPAAPDKTYSKLGGWVTEYAWDPMRWKLPIPPRVADAMDDAQKWTIVAVREALEDYGRAPDPERTAVILGNAMGGERHYLTAMRVYFPDFAHELENVAGFRALPDAVRKEIAVELRRRVGNRLPPITEDSMPGELSNCLAGRVANLYNLHGPNYTADAACASAMAALDAVVEGLLAREFDVAITGGVDRNMGPSTFVKFCKIGALSATGTRPFAAGADGFVMGEGAAILIVKRLEDAERDGDKIYAVLRGIGGSSDGRGKGITAPNPIGQKICLQRAWENAGLSPMTAGMIEGHGTSTRVGDVVEVQSMAEILGNGLPARSIALGSVKSNIGHLKAAAGAAGLLKAALSLRDKVMPPSLHCEHPNPDIAWGDTPLYVNTELREWPNGRERRAGVSAFGFGGTNFHAVLEEFQPGRLSGNGRKTVAVETPVIPATPMPAVVAAPSRKLPLRGAMLVGAASEADLVQRLREIQAKAEQGSAPQPQVPAQSELQAVERVAIDYGSAEELAKKIGKALKAIESGKLSTWKSLRSQGIYRGRGAAPKVAFLYPGQGSQYVNMLAELRATEPIVAETFAEADRIMQPLIGKRLTDLIFVNDAEPAVLAKAEDALRQTAITQPAVLTVDVALTRLLAAHGFVPDMTMGHSLGEYAALVAAGALPFADALEAVSARGREMTRVSVADCGRMAAVIAPLAEIERVLKSVNGYVVIANINSTSQAVIGGASGAVGEAMSLFQQAGYQVIELSVSHAFHTSIVAPASGPLRQVLQRLNVQSPLVPVIANVTGEFYPQGSDNVLDILAQQVASPVQFVKGLRTLYEAGARVFVEIGPKRALQGFTEDVLGEESGVMSLFTNHPRCADRAAFNMALCGLYAAGICSQSPSVNVTATAPQEVPAMKHPTSTVEPSNGASSNGDRYNALGHMFAEVLERGWALYGHGAPARNTAPVVITGAGLGLPGTERIFDDRNVGRILKGDQFIDVIPSRFRRAMLDKNVTRLVKSEDGGPRFETISDVADVIKLAGRGGAFDLEEEFGVPADRIAALDRVTQLAIGAGLDALRDAGIPLVMRYKTTSKGTQLPDRWMLPDALRDDTGVIFASAFPGYDSFAHEMERYYTDRARREEINMLRGLKSRIAGANGHAALGQEIDRRMQELRSALDSDPYVFDRRFLFRILAMGHSQFAEFIGARGPNTQINTACATTTQAFSVAQDWISMGRCRRAIIIACDDVTSDHLMEWIGAGFLASGAAATDESVENAALPFDRRRHGMLIGMGAVAMVVESADAARERGLQPICEVLATITANSAYHGTRLDVAHICGVMEKLMADAETNCGISRRQIADKTVFVSHETYTPARGGSAAAEIHALRQVFGDDADKIVIANTKGFTGHAMAAGIEDVVAVKTLETGIVPPVANFKEVDPELGELNLSKGGRYPVDYALRLAAGFGSQVSMALLHWTKSPSGDRATPDALGYRYRVGNETAWRKWLADVSGDDAAELEVVRRTLRVRDRGAEKAASGKRQVEEAASSKQHVGTTASSKPQVQEPVLPADLPAPQTTTGPQVETKTSSVVSTAEIKQRILAIVSEKTGYPADMLDVDLDLEADLGVDTVKQAEVFAAVREAYGIARDDKIRLRDFPTLAHVIRFVEERQGITAKAASRKPHVDASASRASLVAETETETPKAGRDAVRERIIALVTEKTGYPAEMLDLDLDLEADLGIDTVKQAELFAAIREIYGIERDANLKLRDFPTLTHVIGFVLDRKPELAGVGAKSSANPTTETPRHRASEGKDTEVAVPSGRLGGESSAERPPEAVAAKALDAPSDHEVQEKVLDIVAQHTGYPKEMLDVDLDLEADLGIDTVKQAEVFASVRAAFNIPRFENLKLRDFPTLAHVIRFARQGRVAPSSGPSARLEEPVHTPRVKVAEFSATEQIPRRVPMPVLRPPLALCKQTGATFNGRRVLLVPDHGGVADALEKNLRAAGAEVLTLDLKGTDGLAKRLGELLDGKKIHGVYWLPALDNDGSLQDLPSWRHALDVRLKSLYVMMRAIYEQIAEPGTFLISGTRLGGQHGYGDTPAVAPLGGAVTGFTKAYKRERLDATVKAVDFAAEAAPGEIAQHLMQETLRDPGAVEVGYCGGQRWAVAMMERPAADGRPPLKLDRNSVFVVTGAAGGIVSAITADLASASGGTFYLLDVVPPPDANNPDLRRFATDKEGLKRDLIARMSKDGKKATPAMIEKELAALERAQAAQSAIDAVHAAGGTAHYFSADLRDAASVAKAISEVRKRSGHIDVLLHAAGMERSHLLPDKEPREFDLVFDVKADGWFNLLHAIGDMPLGATVSFSSVAGRFGNAGQADYSSANDLLCKMTSHLRDTHPSTRAIAIDWTAWAGLGMATRGSIPKMMEVAGIDMLPPEAGVPLIRRELTSGGTRGEVVVAQRLGIMQNEWDPAGGIDVTAAEKAASKLPLPAKITGIGLHSGLRLEIDLDPKQQPFLDHHRIDGVPVLPGVMGVEIFSEAASCLLPEWRVAAVEDVNFVAPFKFYRDEPRTLAVEATIHPDGSEIIAECRLLGQRSLPNQSEPQVTTHFTARVRLTQTPAGAEEKVIVGGPSWAVMEACDIYRIYFHGPAYRVMQRAWRDEKRLVGEMKSDLPPDFEGRSLLMAPRMIELCLQTAGLWELAVEDRMALPLHIDSVSLLRAPETAERQLYAEVTPQDGGRFEVEVADAAGSLFLRVRGYRTVQVPQPFDGELLKPLRRVMTEECDVLPV